MAKSRASALVLTGILACAPEATSRYGCRVPALDGEQPLAGAVRCAEEFVARNGYTDQEPTVDSDDIAYESLEFAESLTAQLEERLNTLETRAIGVCVGTPRDSAGFTVVFRYRADSTTSARAVTVSRRFDSLQVAHQDFRLAAVGERESRCMPIGSPASK
jgi:hypothetical protein